MAPDVFVVTDRTAGGRSPSVRSAPTLVGPYVQAPQGIFHAVTKVPLAVFNAVGVSSPSISLLAPSILLHQPTYIETVGGKTIPASFYFGAEYCPYCAASRWGLIVGLSRFGSFNKLYDISSSNTDVDPNTPSFTFHDSTFRSPIPRVHRLRGGGWPPKATHEVAAQGQPTRPEVQPKRVLPLRRHWEPRVPVLVIVGPVRTPGAQSRPDRVTAPEPEEQRDEGHRGVRQLLLGGDLSTRWREARVGVRLVWRP